MRDAVSLGLDGKSDLSCLLGIVYSIHQSPVCPRISLGEAEFYEQFPSCDLDYIALSAPFQTLVRATTKKHPL